MTDYLYTSGGFPASPSSGDSLVINGLFYDWTGTAWKVRSTVSNRVEFIATANQATKTGLTYFVGSIDCYINGAKMLLGTDFTATNGTSVTFTPALDLDDEVQLIMGVSASSAAGGGVVTGTTLPSPVSAVGSLFFKTDDTDLYVSNGTDWEKIQSNAAMVATGGTESTLSNYKIHKFLTSSSFIVSESGEAEIFMVAGGGSGGSAGGGGAGGMKTITLTLNAGTYAVTVGAGGTAVTSINDVGIDGNNSSIGSVPSAIGGGGGGAYSSTTNAITIGRSGGSGGGGGWAASSGGSGTTGQGNSGGTSIDTTGSPWTAAGGGGAGAVGSPDSGGYGGDGGAGQANSWLGASYFFAGGGGGGSQSGVKGGDGGMGGGGGGAFANGGVLGAGGGNALSTGGNSSDRLGGSGGINTGGGGGGQAVTLDTSGAGGSGIVIVRYAI